MRRAIAVFESTSLTLVASAFLRLELAPHAARQSVEREFTERILREIAVWVSTDDALVVRATALRTAYPLAPLDSLHVAAAERAGVERFLNLEKLGKPIYRVTSIGPTYLLDL